MQDAPKAVWSIPYVFVAFFPSLKQNFIAYRSSKVSSRPDCIFEIHQLWQSGSSRVYPNCCCSCSFEPEVIKIVQSSHNMYSNNILNSQVSATILNAHTKKSGNLLNSPCKTYLHTLKYMMLICATKMLCCRGVYLICSEVNPHWVPVSFGLDSLIVSMVSIYKSLISCDTRPLV